MKTLTSVVAVCALAFSIAGCAASLHQANIGEVKRDAGHYADRTVTIDGTVTSSWGVPLVPLKLYKVQDGTGEMTVVSRGGTIPVTGSHVKVKGVVRDVAVFGGQPIGLHLEEQSIDIKRQ